MVEGLYTYTVFGNGFGLHYKAVVTRHECVRKPSFGYILSNVIVFVVGLLDKQELFLFVRFDSC